MKDRFIHTVRFAFKSVRRIGSRNTIAAERRKLSKVTVRFLFFHARLFRMILFLKTFNWLLGEARRKQYTFLCDDGNYRLALRLISSSHCTAFHSQIGLTSFYTAKARTETTRTSNDQAHLPHGALAECGQVQCLVGGGGRWDFWYQRTLRPSFHSSAHPSCPTLPQRSFFLTYQQLLLLATFM